MKYFSYVKTIGIEKAYEIYEAVWSLQRYAKTIYNGLWKDALDRAFFHTLLHYDGSRGTELNHYVTKVVKTIFLNKYSHELESETAVEIKSGEESYSHNETDPLGIMIRAEDLQYTRSLEKCVEYLLPSFVIDYVFFVSRNPDDRKLEYPELFQKFTFQTIDDAMKYLTAYYYSDMSDLNILSKKRKYRNFSGDRYKKSLDPSVEYVGTINNIVIYKHLVARGKRFFYKIDIKRLINNIVEAFYSKDSDYRKDIENISVFCSISGQIVINEDNLKEKLEDEIIGAILAKNTRLKVAHYSRGNEIILTSPRNSEDGIILNICDNQYGIGFTNLVSKCLKEEKDRVVSTKVS